MADRYVYKPLRQVVGDWLLIDWRSNIVKNYSNTVAPAPCVLHFFLSYNFVHTDGGRVVSVSASSRPGSNDSWLVGEELFYCGRTCTHSTFISIFYNCFQPCLIRVSHHPGQAVMCVNKTASKLKIASLVKWDHLTLTTEYNAHTLITSTPTACCLW